MKTDVEKSILYCDQEIKLSELLGSDQYKREGYLTKGEGLVKIKKYKIALTFYDKALGLDYRYGNKQGEALIYFLKGELFVELNDKNRSISNYEKAYFLYKEIEKEVYNEDSDFKNSALLAFKLAFYYRSINNLEEAYNWANVSELQSDKNRLGKIKALELQAVIQSDSVIDFNIMFLK